MSTVTDAGNKLKKSSVLTGLSFLHSTLMFGPLLPLVYALAGMTDGYLTRQYILGGCLLVPVILSWLAVRHCRALWMYALSGAAAAVLAGVLAREPVFPALTVFLWLIRGSVRIKKGRLRKEYMELPAGEGAVTVPEAADIPMFLDEPQPVHLIMTVLFYLVSLMVKSGETYRFIFAVLCMDIAVCFLFRYLAGFYSYVEEHQSVASLPVRTMRKIVRLLLAPAFLILLLAMMPAVFYGKEPLKNIRLHSSGQAGYSVEYQPSDSQLFPGNQMLDGLSDETPWELPPWAGFVLQAFLWMIFLFAAALVIFGIFRGLRAMNRAFLKEEEDEITFLGSGEKGRRREVQNRVREPHLFLTPDRRIRRKFKKSARLAMKKEKKQPQGIETPAELEKYMKDAHLFADTEGEETLRRLYEKARYSQESCSREEAEQAEAVR